MPLDDILKSVKEKLSYGKEATIQDIKFNMSVLTLKEEQSLSAIPVDEKEDGLAYFNEMRKNLLSFAIKAIEGEKIPDIVETKDEKGENVKKDRSIYIREFLDKMPAAIIEDLFEIYIDLREEVESDIIKSVKYKWFKDPDTREKERLEKERKAAELEAATKEAAKVAEPKKPEEAPITFTKLPDEPVKDEPEKT